MILFFYGPNQYAARAKLKETVERYMQKNGDIGLERIDGIRAEASRLMQTLSTVPFLASTRLVVVEDLGQNKPAADAMVGQLEQIPDTTNVIFYESSVDKRTSYFKSLSKPTGTARVVVFEQLPAAKLQRWIVAKAHELGGEISSQTASFLLEQTGSDQWRLEQEIQKLVNYQPSINQASIQELVDTVFHNNVFDMVDAIASGNTRQAVRTYMGLRQAGEDPYKIMGMIGWQLHNLLVALAGQDLAPAELAKKAGVAPFVAQKANRSLANINKAKLAHMYKLLVSADQELKTSGVEPDVLLEQLIVNLSRIYQKSLQ